MASQNRSPGKAVISTGPTDARFHAATTSRSASWAIDIVLIASHTDA